MYQKAHLKIFRLAYTLKTLNNIMGIEICEDKELNDEAVSFWSTKTIWWTL